MTRSTPDTDPLGAAIRAAAGEIRAPEALRARVADQRAAAPGLVRRGRVVRRVRFRVFSMPL